MHIVPSFGNEIKWWASQKIFKSKDLKKASLQLYPSICKWERSQSTNIPTILGGICWEHLEIAMIDLNGGIFCCHNFSLIKKTKCLISTSMIWNSNYSWVTHFKPLFELGFTVLAV